jgi:hypothetical protein
VRPLVLSVLLVCSSLSSVGRAQTRAAAPAPLPKVVSTETTCAAVLGSGVKTKRRFCDVVITTSAAESVTMKIPPHVGSAVLQFDLHNRFDISTSVLSPRQFSRQLATVAVVRSTGAVIEREAVVGELRGAADAFDRIEPGVVEGGAGPGGARATAPGQPQAIRLTIPAGVTSIGILGIKLSVTGKTGATEVFETPGRPIAVVSNVRIEYTPIK